MGLGRFEQYGNSEKTKNLFFENRMVFVALEKDISDEIAMEEDEMDEPNPQDIETETRKIMKENGLSESVARKFAIKDLKQKMRLASAKRMAVTDNLMGIFNQREFFSRIEGECNRANRYGGKGFGLIMIDIDHFKNVNDTLGHLGGDQVLKEVAKILKKSIRNNVDILCRYGGEEMMIIMPETDKEGLAMASEKIRRAIEENVMAGGKPVTVSLGYVQFDKKIQDLNNPKGLIARADAALYKSKNTGRNRSTGFEDRMPLNPKSQIAQIEGGSPLATVEKVELSPKELEDLEKARSLIPKDPKKRAEFISRL